MFPALLASEKVPAKGRDLTFESEAVTQHGAGETCRSAFAVLERAGWATFNIAGSSGLGIHAGGAQRNHTIQALQTHMSTCTHEYLLTLNTQVPEDQTGKGDERRWLDLTGSGVVTSHPGLCSGSS